MAKLITTILLTVIAICILYVHFFNFNDVSGYYFPKSYANPCYVYPPGGFGPLCNLIATPQQQRQFIIDVLSTVLIVTISSYVISCCIFTLLHKPQKRKNK